MGSNHQWGIRNPLLCPFNYESEKVGPLGIEPRTRNYEFHALPLSYGPLNYAATCFNAFAIDFLIPIFRTKRSLLEQVDCPSKISPVGEMT